MTTFTPRGFPLYDGTPGGDNMPAWDVGYNAHSNALETALDDAETADHAGDSVETIIALPVTGNWVGRLIYVEEDDRIRRWDGTQWGVIAFPPSIRTTPTMGPGWDTPSINKIYQRSGWVQLNFNAYRTTAGAAGDVIVEVPVGYRGDHVVWSTAAGLDGAPATVLCQYDTTTEEVKLWQALPDDTSIALTMMWPIEGAT